MAVNDGGPHSRTRLERFSGRSSTIVEKAYPKVRMYRRVEDMMDDPDIDLVDIALPTTDHQSAALESLNRGRYTLLETPLALSHDAATILKAASVKAQGRLFAYTPGLFAPDFRLAQSALDNPALGDIYDVRVRRQDYLRRDDWQATAKRGGGAAHYAAQEPVLQALSLLKAPPVQMWSEMKKIVRKALLPFIRPVRARAIRKASTLMRIVETIAKLTVNLKAFP